MMELLKSLLFINRIISVTSKSNSESDEIVVINENCLSNDQNISNKDDAVIKKYNSNKFYNALMRLNIKNKKKSNDLILSNTLSLKNPFKSIFSKKVFKHKKNGDNSTTKEIHKSNDNWDCMSILDIKIFTVNRKVEKFKKDANKLINYLYFMIINSPIYNIELCQLYMPIASNKINSIKNFQPVDLKLDGEFKNREYYLNFRKDMFKDIFEVNDSFFSKSYELISNSGINIIFLDHILKLIEDEKKPRGVWNMNELNDCYSYNSLVDHIYFVIYKINSFDVLNSKIKLYIKNFDKLFKDMSLDENDKVSWREETIISKFEKLLHEYSEIKCDAMQFKYATESLKICIKKFQKFKNELLMDDQIMYICNYISLIIDKDSIYNTLDLNGRFCCLIFNNYFTKTQINLFDLMHKYFHETNKLQQIEIRYKIDNTIKSLKSRMKIIEKYELNKNTDIYYRKIVKYLKKRKF
ncbi:hypothetical protein TCON_0152 [Astathelohania contejeani]|uniref:Uncharacterized protein n=1 Tax=Astathelohania contejeani TaxID=164912 RepID=A0ABQ7I2T7_9MICR|nr:hypothetical protein TCON_0152 [Thelohania contejeani]